MTGATFERKNAPLVELRKKIVEMIEKNASLVETDKQERYLKYCVSATDLLLMKEETTIHLEATETFRSR